MYHFKNTPHKLTGDWTYSVAIAVIRAIHNIWLTLSHTGCVCTIATWKAIAPDDRFAAHVYVDTIHCFGLMCVLLPVRCLLFFQMCFSCCCFSFLVPFDLSLSFFRRSIAFSLVITIQTSPNMRKKHKLCLPFLCVVYFFLSSLHFSTLLLLFGIFIDTSTCSEAAQHQPCLFGVFDSCMDFILWCSLLVSIRIHSPLVSRLLLCIISVSSMYW